jgi:sulfur carrier protein ThiS
MKVTINMKPRDVPPGSRLSHVVEIIREANRDDPVIKALVDKTGKDHLTFILNKRIVPEKDFDRIDLQDGDDIRWMRPYAGG